MKIAFIPGSCAPFHGKSLTERPLGGTETAVIRLAEALDKLGHNVTVVSHFENPPLSRPLYIPVRAMDDLGDVDVLIGVRELIPIFLNVKAKVRMYWTGDSYDQLQHIGLGDKRTIEKLNTFLAVSNWQANRLCEVSGFPRRKTWVLRNGVAAELFQGDRVRKRKQLIYSSTPARGLAILRKLFPLIHQQHPDAELHVYSGMDVYDGAGGSAARLERPYRPLLESLRSLEGCVVHGNVTQDQLAQAFMESAVLAYPNTFEETSCITALEAMTGGCTIVTSRRGALPETIEDSGILISGDPNSLQYQKEFVDAVCKLLSDDILFTELQRRGLERAVHYTWDAVALEFSNFLEKKFKRI